MSYRGEKLILELTPVQIRALGFALTNISTSELFGADEKHGEKLMKAVLEIKRRIEAIEEDLLAYGFGYEDDFGEEKAIERYGKKLYWEFVELGFSGKPLGIKEVYTHIDYDILSTELQKLIDDLPVVTIDESWDRGFFSDKLDGTQQFYIAIDKETESVFLIDTQGYEYARYVSHLKNMPCAKKERGAS